VTPRRLADVLWGAYRVIGQNVPEEQRWLAVAFAAIGALEPESTIGNALRALAALTGNIEVAAPPEIVPQRPAADPLAPHQKKARRPHQKKARRG
jgi:hypothetical protein